MVYKVLIVDDSKLARMSVIKWLKTLRPDWPLVEATDADEALALAGQSTINIALVDFNMPGRDGLTLAAEIRELDPDIAVALITANVQREVVNRAREIGATFLAKPLTVPDLDAFLAQAEQALASVSP